MKLKKKLADAKAKLKEHAPEIAIVSATAAAFAYGLYSAFKNIPVLVETASQNDEERPRVWDEIPEDWEVIAAVSMKDLNQLAEDDSYEVTNIDSDLFRIKKTDN